MKRSELIFSTITVPLDYLALILAGLAAYFIRYLPAIQRVRPVIFDLPIDDYMLFVAAIAIGWLAIFALSGLYTIGGTRKMGEELSKIVVACSAGLALVLAIMVFSRYLFDSRFIILVAWIFTIIFVGIERMMVRLTQRLAFRFGVGTHRVVIVGNSQVAESLVKEFTNRPGLGYRVVSQFLNFDDQASVKLEEMAKKDSFDEIIQINIKLSPEETSRLIDFADDYHLVFKYAADLLGTKLANIDIRTIGGVPVVEVKKTRLDGWGRIYKRTFDIIGSAVLIILLSPLLLLIALAVKLDSAGPVFFKYKRIGQYGKPFTYFKFRSMIKDAHQLRYDENFLKQQENLRNGTPMMKFKNDPRITRVGKLIRRFSLDELPELFLVLIGKMSLVGPRPHEVEEVSRYERHHKKLLTIKPGMTGLAQVSGRSDLDFEQEVKLDTYYIENWSIGTDFQILSKTPLAVFKKREAE